MRLFSYISVGLIVGASLFSYASAGFYPAGTVCTAANSTFLSTGQSLVFPKVEGKYVLCVKEQGYINPFAGHTISAQSPVLFVGSSLAIGTRYFVDGARVWDFANASNSAIYNPTWGKYMNPTNGTPIQIIPGEVVSSKVYYYDVTKPYCDLPSTALLRAADNSTGIPTGSIIPMNTWYSGSVQVEVKCKDDLSGCKTPSKIRAVQHSNTGTQVTFEDNAGFGGGVGNISSPTCTFPMVLIDTIPPDVLINDGGTNPAISTSSDTADANTWWYYYASGVTFHISVNDQYVPGIGVSTIRSIKANVAPKSSPGTPVCTLDKAYTIPADAATRRSDFLASQDLICSDTQGIQKKGDYLLTVSVIDFAGNETKITQDIRVVPNMKISANIIPGGPSVPVPYANGVDRYSYQTIMTDSYGNAISGKDIISVTQTGALRLSLDDRNPTSESALLSPTGVLTKVYAGTIKQKVKTPIPLSSFSTFSSSPYKASNSCYANYSGPIYSSTESKYKYTNTSNPAIYFFADNARPITCKSYFFSKKGWTPVNPYSYEFQDVPQYSTAFAEAAHVTSTVDGMFSFIAKALVGGDFTNLFDIKMQKWDRRNIDLPSIQTVTGGSSLSSRFARLYQSTMKLGDGETSLRFGQKQSLIFSPEVNPSQAVYVSNVNFENANSLKKSYSGYVITGLSVDSGNPNIVYFTPVLTGKFTSSPKIEAFPRVSYTIGGKNVSYPMSTSFSTFDSLIGESGSINSIFIEGYQSSVGNDNIVSNAVNVGAVTLAQVGNQIRKQIGILTRNRSINDGLFIGGIKYVSGDQMLQGEVSDWTTLVVMDGNVTISDNFNTAKKNIGIILLHDKDLTKSNIYIYPNVGFIGATIYADGSIESTDMTGNIFTTSDKTRSDSLMNQIVFYGGIYSHNTIGGATQGAGVSSYFLPGKQATSDIGQAVRFDLSFLRMGNIGFDDAGKTQKYNAGHPDSVVVLRNYEALTHPPAGFEK